MQAATKYVGGHSDIMFGTISANAEAWPMISEAIRLLGVCAGPDDVFLALRGLRTLAVRLAQHHRSALRSEEHTSELHHLGISYAVFCLKKKKKTKNQKVENL